MDIDITAFIHGESDPFDFSRSAAEAGQNAGPDSWRDALAEASAHPMLDTPEKLDAMRDFIRGFGAWNREEIAAMSDDKLNALLIQFISGDMREAGMDACDPEDFDWTEYQVRASAGEISGRIYRADVPDHASFGRVFFSLDA